MQKVRKLFQLPLRELLVLIQAVLLLSVVRIALRFTTVARLKNVKSIPLSCASGLRAQDISRMVQIAAEHGFGPARCLERSLVLHWFLSRQGVDSRILVGTRKENGQVEAHAWVEINGVPLNDHEDVEQRFPSFEGSLLDT
jgi:Transglutaminase-like superfamily